MFRRFAAVSFATLFILGTSALRADENAPNPGGNTCIAIPSGIAHLDSQSIYVSGPSETLTALDLESGEPRWESKDAQLPLAVAGDRVIGRTSQIKLPPNAMQLVVLDAASSKVQLRCRQIVFPEWVAVSGGLGLSFDCVGAVEGNTLTITWHAGRELTVTEGKATPEMIAAAKKTTTGTVLVDLESGENKVFVDPAPKKLTLNRKQPFYEVGDKRLNVTQRTEKVDGGVQLVHRMLEARDTKTGKPVWQQPIAGEVYLPVGLPPQVNQRPQQQQRQPSEANRRPQYRQPTRR